MDIVVCVYCIELQILDYLLQYAKYEISNKKGLNIDNENLFINVTGFFSLGILVMSYNNKLNYCNILSTNLRMALFLPAAM